MPKENEKQKLGLFHIKRIYKTKCNEWIWLDPGLKTKAMTDILGTTEKTKTEGWYLI